MKTAIISAMALAGLATGGALAQTGIEEYGCAAMSNDGQGAAGLPGYSILEETSEDGRFSFGISADFHVSGIMCRRNSIIPAEFDFEVPLSGYPLYISTDGADGSRIVVLTIEDEQFVVRVLEGRLTAAERARVASRIESYYARLDTES